MPPGTAGLSYWQARNRPKFRFAKVEKGDITSVVNSTGEVRPVLSVAVGSFVSGPVIRIHGDFNQRVKKGDLLAEIDPRIYAALVAAIKRRWQIDSPKSKVSKHSYSKPCKMKNGRKR